MTSGGRARSFCAAIRWWPGWLPACLLWTAFPPLEWNWLAWVALAPLFWLVTLREARLKAYLAAWLGGSGLLAAGSASGFSVLDAGRLDRLDRRWRCSFPCWWPLFLAVAPAGRLSACDIPLMLAAPIIWVGLEYGRAYFLSGFPWYYLAHSQFRHLYLIQIADFASSLGISLLIAVVNAMLVDLVTLPLFGRSQAGNPAAPAAVRAALPGHLPGGHDALLRSDPGLERPVPRRAPAGPLAVEHRAEAQEQGRRADPIIAEFAELVDDALGRREPPDLIVWPETSYPYGFIAVDPARRARDPRKQVRSIAPKLSGQGLAGTDGGDRRTSFIPGPTGPGCRCWWERIFYDHQPEPRSTRYNSAILFLPNLRAIHFYHKMHLVPFGEYFPLIETSAVAGGPDALRRRKASEL